jgi:hypothetical protein
MTGRGRGGVARADEWVTGGAEWRERSDWRVAVVRRFRDWDGGSWFGNDGRRGTRGCYVLDGVVTLNVV